MDRFADFRLPLGVTEGVEIPLGTTGATFTVSLPSQMNEEYQMRFMAAMNSKVDDEANVTIDFDPGHITRIRKQVFLATCILSASGLPEGMTPTDFLTSYPLAAKFLFERANALGLESDRQVEVALGNLGVSWNGRSPGRATNATTKPSSEPGSQSPTQDLNSAA